MSGCAAPPPGTRPPEGPEGERVASECPGLNDKEGVGLARCSQSLLLSQGSEEKWASSRARDPWEPACPSGHPPGTLAFTTLVLSGARTACTCAPPVGRVCPCVRSGHLFLSAQKGSAVPVHPVLPMTLPPQLLGQHWGPTPMVFPQPHKLAPWALPAQHPDQPPLPACVAMSQP